MIWVLPLILLLCFGKAALNSPNSGGFTSLSTSFPFTFCRIKNTAGNTRISGDKYNAPQGREGHTYWRLICICLWICISCCKWIYCRLSLGWAKKEPPSFGGNRVHTVQDGTVEEAASPARKRPPRVGRTSRVPAGHLQTEEVVCTLIYTGVSTFRLKRKLA